MCQILKFLFYEQSDVYVKVFGNRSETSSQKFPLLIFSKIFENFGFDFPGMWCRVVSSLSSKESGSFLVSKKYPVELKDTREEDWLVACDYVKEQGFGAVPSDTRCYALKRVPDGFEHVLIQNISSALVYWRSFVSIGGASMNRLSRQTHSHSHVFDKEALFCLFRFLGVAPSRHCFQVHPKRIRRMSDSKEVR